MQIELRFPKLNLSFGRANEERVQFVSHKPSAATFHVDIYKCVFYLHKITLHLRRSTISVSKIITSLSFQSTVTCCWLLLFSSVFELIWHRKQQVFFYSGEKEPIMCCFVWENNRTLRRYTVDLVLLWLRWWKPCVRSCDHTQICSHTSTRDQHLTRWLEK